MTEFVDILAIFVDILTEFIDTVTQFVDIVAIFIDILTEFVCRYLDNIIHMSGHWFYHASLYQEYEELSTACEEVEGDII